MKSALRSLAILPILLTLTGCDIKKDSQAAADGVDTFHQRFNDSKFAEIYSASNAELKGATPEEAFVRLLSSVRSQLGAYQSGSQTGWDIKVVNGSTRFVLTYQSKFEKGSGVESFTFEVNGDTSTLQGYHINSPELITK